VTRLEEAIETQRAIEQANAGFMAEISRLCVAERIRLEEVEHGYTEGEGEDDGDD